MSVLGFFISNLHDVSQLKPCFCYIATHKNTYGWISVYESTSAHNQI